MSPTISRRAAVLAALSTAAGAALPTVALADAAPDVPSLPAGMTLGHLSLYHAPADGPDGWRSLTIRIEPDAAGVPRLRLLQPRDDLSLDEMLDPTIDSTRPVDADAEPELYHAAAVLIAALLDAA